MPAFKTLLFLAAGSVLHATGTRDLDELGGLRAAMPATTAAFGLGALAASALPPGNGVRQRVAAAAGADPRTARAGDGGRDRDAAGGRRGRVDRRAGGGHIRQGVRGRVSWPARAARRGRERTESPPTMLAGMGLAAAACVVLAVAADAGRCRRWRGGGRGRSGPDRRCSRDGMTLRLAGVAGSLSPLLLAVALVVAAVASRWPCRGPLRRRRGPAAARLWDCGAGPLSARMEYTATSFAEPLQRVFDDVLQPEQDVDVTHQAESRYLVRTVRVPAPGAGPDRAPAVRAGAGRGRRVGPGRAPAGAAAACTATSATASTRCCALLILLVVTR